MTLLQRYELDVTIPERMEKLKKLLAMFLNGNETRKKVLVHTIRNTISSKGDVDVNNMVYCVEVKPLTMSEFVVDQYKQVNIPNHAKFTIVKCVHTDVVNPVPNPTFVMQVYLDDENNIVIKSIQTDRFEQDELNYETFAEVLMEFIGV